MSELNVLELEFLSVNDFALFVSLEELQNYGDQLLSHWKREHEITEMEIQAQVEEEELAPPVRRRARHLSIDKHGDEIDVTNSNYNNNSTSSSNSSSERVYKKPSIP